MESKSRRVREVSARSHHTLGAVLATHAARGAGAAAARAAAPRDAARAALAPRAAARGQPAPRARLHQDAPAALGATGRRAPVARAARSCHS